MNMNHKEELKAKLIILKEEEMVLFYDIADYQNELEFLNRQIEAIELELKEDIEPYGHDVHIEIITTSKIEPLEIEGLFERWLSGSGFTWKISVDDLPPKLLPEERIEYMKNVNYKVFKFADIISDVIIDYRNGMTEYKDDKEVLEWILELCNEKMENRSE